MLITRMCAIAGSISETLKNHMHYWNSCVIGQLATFNKTATVALWLRRPPREREVVGSIPGRVLPKTKAGVDEIHSRRTI